MSGKKIYLALCAIAIGKSVIQPGKQLPADVSAGKIKSLLENKSIELADASTVVGDGSGQSLPPASNTQKEFDPGTGDTNATLTGVVTKDGRVVELNKLKVDELKKLATELKIAGADQMKKADLVGAITAVEFEVKE